MDDYEVKEVRVVDDYEVNAVRVVDELRGEWSEGSG